MAVGATMPPVVVPPVVPLVPPDVLVPPVVLAVPPVVVVVVLEVPPLIVELDVPPVMVDVVPPVLVVVVVVPPVVAVVVLASSGSGSWLEVQPARATPKSAAANVDLKFIGGAS
jgi:hypothetical protein